MSLPLISVIIPVYNGATFIERAIRSALAQDYPAKEIIVVDDGSTDETPEVVGRLSEAIYIRQENAGPAAARNRGIRASKGEFVAFLDADDEYLPQRLSSAVKPMIEDRGMGLTYCRSLRRLANGRSEVYGARFEKMQPFKRLMWPSALQCTPATTCRRAILDHVGLFDETLTSREDQDLWIRIAEVSRVREVHEPLVVVNVREGSLSKQLSFDQEEKAYFRILQAAMTRRPDIYESYRSTLIAEAWWFWATKHLAVGRAIEARNLLRKSLAEKPSWKVMLHLTASYLPTEILKTLHKRPHR